MMFSVIYSFQVKKGSEKLFEADWKELTKMFRDFAGGLGSRLHLAEENSYIAYAQWPNKKAWEEAGNKLPEEALEVRIRMRNSCEAMKTLHQLHLVEDMLVK
ncbi:antibiotic biosynthesis monooxygenase [uncultured Draconibacterium sp.]|uniref:antibiotic biosynthesis monooxygenase family protein n=1 Tax=uncultured Draconibacterium sp. TaxID=1573823 RepID=UPI0029C691D9|nr:antibiotic biosynthesis monooxygenase [uncultured Draconibacterium sp.]